MEIRNFTVKDVRIIAGILAKISKDSRLRNIMNAGETSPANSQPTNEQETAEQYGLFIASVIGEIYEAAEAEVFAWFASLINKTVDELNEMAADTVLNIIDAIVDKKESKDFFSTASALFRKINGSPKPTKNAKTRQ